MGRRLTRSVNEKVFAGVCGGIAEYFNLDPTIVRLGFLIATFLGNGIGFIAYIIALVIMPKGDKYKPPQNFYENVAKTDYDEDKDFSEIIGDRMDKKTLDPGKNKTFIGVCLILFGGILLLKDLIKIEIIIPVVLIVVGGFIIYSSRRNIS